MTDADSNAAGSANGSAAGSTTTEPTPEDVRVTDPSDAFQALGNEVRTGILETMLARVDDEDAPARVSFSTLFAASSVDTTAGFAYHLDELVGPYLEKDGEGYAFTYAGRKIARAVAAGAYTRRVSQSSVPIDDPCPFCDAVSLEATASDNVVTIGCRDCERSILRMGFPPTGFSAHGDDLPDAFDRHHRHRIALLADGVCPECSGDVDADISPVSLDDAASNAPERPAGTDEYPDPVQAGFECRQCGYDLHCPVTLTVLDHPAVVGFYEDHAESVRTRPIWNVGHEWTETPLARDPTAVRVAVTLGDETLECYVDATCSVVATRRIDVEESDERTATGDGDCCAESETDTVESEPVPEADVA